MRDMGHSICIIKLYQITMRKKFDFLFLTTLNVKKLSAVNPRSELVEINQLVTVTSDPEFCL